MKMKHSQRTTFEHYLTYDKTPFGRKEEFKDVTSSKVMIKQQKTQHYGHIGIFSRKLKTKVSYIIFVEHKFNCGAVGGVVKHGVLDEDIKNAVERCFAKPPAIGWSVLV